MTLSALEMRKVYLTVPEKVTVIILKMLALFVRTVSVSYLYAAVEV